MKHYIELSSIIPEQANFHIQGIHIYKYSGLKENTRIFVTGNKD
jgi:hypothetical protein